MAARVIAVAEAYDFLTNKSGMTSKEAVYEIEKLSGTEFDPNIVKAFVKTIA